MVADGDVGTWGTLRASPEEGVVFVAEAEGKGKDSEPQWRAAFYQVVLHAVARGDGEGEVDRTPHLYFQIDRSDPGEEDANEEGSTEEVRFEVEDPAVLEAVFEELSEMAARAPRAPWELDEPGDEDDDDDDDDGEANAEAKAANALLASVLAGTWKPPVDADADADDDGQFDDA